MSLLASTGVAAASPPVPLFAGLDGTTASTGVSTAAGIRAAGPAGVAAGLTVVIIVGLVTNPPVLVAAAAGLIVLSVVLVAVELTDPDVVLVAVGLAVLADVLVAAGINVRTLLLAAAGSATVVTGVVVAGVSSPGTAVERRLPACPGLRDARAARDPFRSAPSSAAPSISTPGFRKIAVTPLLGAGCTDGLTEPAPA